MLDTVGKCECVVMACADTWIITAWYNRGKKERKGYKWWEKNAPAERPDESMWHSKEQLKTGKSGRN